MAARMSVLRLRAAASGLLDRCRTDVRRFVDPHRLAVEDAFTLPDFMCIGAQKAGTTWLWENLGCHPEVFLPADRYLHYFDRHFERPLDEYAGHFAAAGGRVKGEVIPGYGLIPRHRIAYVRAILPRLRLMFILRNPVERA